MRIIERRITYKSRSTEFHIYPLGDEHLGTKHCAERKLTAKHKEIHDDPFALWLGMGDKCEFIVPKDKRFDGGAIADWVAMDNIGVSQSKRYCELVNSNKDKCLGLLEGNHEDYIKFQSNLDVQSNICDELGVESLSNSAFVKLIFKRAQGGSFAVTIFATHGAGCAITKGAKLNRLQRNMDNFEADIHFHGHVHDIITDTKPYLTVNKMNELEDRIKVGAMTGCWFRTYSQDISPSYGEKKNYPPTMIGCPMVTIRPDKREIKVQGV